MNSQQKQFADEYLIDLNGTQAAIRAGYSPNSARSHASELLNIEDIAAYISERQKKVSEKLGWTFEKLLIKFAENAERCMQAEPVLDRDGNPTGEYKFDPANANRAYENIGKHLGFYEKDNRQQSDLIVTVKEHKRTVVDYSAQSTNEVPGEDI